MPEAVKLSSGRHHDVGGQREIKNTHLCPLSTSQWRFIAGRHHHSEIQIAVRRRLAPGVGAEEPDLLRVKLGDEPRDGGVDGGLDLGSQGWPDWSVERGGWHGGRMIMPELGCSTDVLPQSPLDEKLASSLLA